MTPFVSILLPVWNAEATLDVALRSVARQDLADWECLVVDDGSTDASPRIAADWARRDPRFRLLARPHAGLVASLNAGLDACRAEFVARLDADDFMRRPRLARQRALLETHPELEAVGCGVRSFPRTGLSEGRRAYEAWLNALDSPAAIWRDRFVECPVAHPALMIRTHTLRRLGYADRDWPEDYDLMLRLLGEGPVVGTVPRRLLGWRDMPTRLSRTDPRCGLDRFMACRAHYLARDFLGDSERYVLCGYGATGRSLKRALEAEGRRPSAIVDVHPRRIGNRIDGVSVFSHETLRIRPAERLVVSVAGEGPRNGVRRLLDGWGYAEGIDYVCAA